MSALPLIATAKADTEAHAPPEQTRAPAVPGGGGGSGLRTVRPNTRDYSALPGENFVCSSTPSATFPGYAQSGRTKQSISFELSF